MMPEYDSAPGPSAPGRWDWRRFPASLEREVALIAGVLYVVGGTLVASTLVLPSWEGMSTAWVGGVSAVAVCVGAAFLLVAGRVRLPPWLLVSTTALGTVLISLTVRFGGQRGSVLFGVLYVFVAAYAFYYFPRWLAVGQVALVALAYAVALVPYGYPDALTSWWLVVGSSVVAGALIGSLGQRNRTLLLTEQAATAALQEVDEWRTTFLQTVAHDLRAPLTLVLASIATLQEYGGGVTPEQQDELLAHALDGGERLQRMLEDLLDVERIEAGAIEPRLEATALDQLVRDTVDRISMDGQHVEVDVEPMSVPVEPAKIERIVDNLVGNARRHTPVGTTVRVALEARDGGALLTVSDDGPGIPDHLRDGLFEPFHGSRKGPGTTTSGLGLALVARYTQLHGGEVWVESQPGGGACFCVLLPGATSHSASPTSGA